MARLVLAMAILATTSCLGAFFLLTRGQEVPGIAEAIDDPIFKAAHKYHGISGSIEYGGENFFFREGKRCELFSQAFLETYKGYRGR